MSKGDSHWLFESCFIVASCLFANWHWFTDVSISLRYVLSCAYDLFNVSACIGQRKKYWLRKPYVIMACYFCTNCRVFIDIWIQRRCFFSCLHVWCSIDARMCHCYKYGLCKSYFILPSCLPGIVHDLTKIQLYKGAPYSAFMLDVVSILSWISVVIVRQIIFI